MRGGVRKTIALETRDESDAIRMALELANGPDLAIGGTLEGEIEAFIAFDPHECAIAELFVISKAL